VPLQGIDTRLQGIDTSVLSAPGGCSAGDRHQAVPAAADEAHARAPGRRARAGLRDPHLGAAAAYPAALLAKHVVQRFWEFKSWFYRGIHWPNTASYKV